MPGSSIIPAIVGSIIGAIADSPPQQPQTPVFEAVARPFPTDSKKGELVPPIEQDLTISGNKIHAAPGLQIRNQQNLIVMPSTLQAAVPVRYQLDPMGNVWRIWLLSAAEASAPDPKQ